MSDNFSNILNQWITAPADVRALGLATLVLSEPERETVARVLEALASQPAAAAPAPQPQPEEAEAPARRRGRDVGTPRRRRRPQVAYVRQTDPAWFPGTVDQQLQQAIRLWAIFSQRCTVADICEAFGLSLHYARKARAELLAEGIVEIANENRGTMRLARKRLNTLVASEEDVRRERSQLPAALATMIAARGNRGRGAAVSDALDLFGRVQALDRTAIKAALRSARLIAPRSGGNGQRDTWIGPSSLVDRDEDGEPAAPALWVVT
jgi:hypothetical protein